MPSLTKIAIVLAGTLIVLLFLRLINIKREFRGQQSLLFWLSPLLAVAGMVWAYLRYGEISFAEDSRWYEAEVFAWNMVIAGAYLVVKLILCPLLLHFWKKNSLVELVAGNWYEYDDDSALWFLKLRCLNYREALRVLTWVTALLCVVIMSLGWLVGTESPWWFKVFPVAALLAVSEAYHVLGGYTKTEYLHDVSGEEITASRFGAYYKLRKIYESMFPAALLVSHTGNEHSGKLGAAEQIKRLSESADPLERVVGKYFSHSPKSDGLFDVDMVAATNTLLHGESIVVFNPFYRDLSDYLLLPFVHHLIHDKKCLIIVGRNALCEDVCAWTNDILKNYSRTRSLWRVAELSEKAPDCEVGILSFSQIYDTDVINANKEFFEDTEFVLLIEPSKMMTTSQSGLSILVETMNETGRPAFCICDRQVDGLVDAMSHVLQINLTTVIAAPIPRSVYTAMGWSATGDFMRQKLFNRQTHYLGNGMELAAVALKNQIPHVSWYSSEKAPVQDIRWIAGQYYPQICGYTHLPSQQLSLDERISFASNLWGSSIRSEEFVIVEDEFCNLFSTLRAFLTRGSSQSFVNVISENYLLRDYMRYNRQLFMADPKALPAVAPYYAKTERNTVFRLILMMVCSPVKESYIAHELSLLGYKTEDVYRTLSNLIYYYTFVEDSIITVQNKQELDEDLAPVQVRCYSISRHIFNKNFAKTLKNAAFVVEDEKFDTEYIDARLFEHITQIIMPGQFVTYSGKYYQVHAVSPQVGCILHRAADRYTNRRYYRQLRTYCMEPSVEPVSGRRVMDLEMAWERRSFHVDTTGYLEMQDAHDLRTAKIIDLRDDPAIDTYQRAYKHKTVLRISLPDTDERMRFTICVLLGEMFRSIFPDAWPYLAVLCSRPEDVEGMLDKFSYRICGDVDENMIYIIEDSDMDLGLLEAVESQLMHLFEILADYLDWHFEKMREAPVKDPVLKEIDVPEADLQRKNFISRLARRLRQIFGNNEEQTAKHEEEKPVQAEPENEAKQEPVKEETAEVVPFAEEETMAPVAEEKAELSENFEFGQDNAEEESIDAEEQTEEIKPAEMPETSLPAEEQIIVHSDGEDLFASDGVPDDLDLLMPIEPSRYQKECFLKLGFDEIDSRLAIEPVSTYLTVRGWGSNDLTRARKRAPVEDTLLDTDIENCCDFCGLPLSGVSYDRLTDGRIRCNDCSMAAINRVEQFRELFHYTENMMEDAFSVRLPINITVKTTDARTIARHTGQIFRPSKKYAARVLGFAQRKNGRYSLFVENGSPRLGAIDVTSHELTHIWQYLNWNDAQIKQLYGMRSRECTMRAREIVYEGMAVWTAIQTLYIMGETSYAQRQERIMELRRDTYGLGFQLYRERFGLERSGEAPALSPFMSYPPLDPADVIAASRSLCGKGDKCKC